MKFVFRRINYKGRNSFSYTKAQTQYNRSTYWFSYYAVRTTQTHGE